MIRSKYLVSCNRRGEIDGKPSGVEVVGVFDVDANGRITRWRDYYDFPTLRHSKPALRGTSA